MTAPTPQDAAPDQPAVEPVVEAPVAQPETDWKAEAEKWKQFSRQNEDRAKANADAASKLKEIEDRDLSDLQRVQRDLETERVRADKAESAALRRQVALDKGIPSDLVDTLAGGSLEELTAHADRLIAWRGNVAPAPVPQPRPDMGQGAQPVDPATELEATYQAYLATVRPSTHRK